MRMVFKLSLENIWPSAARDLNFHQIRAAFDVAERRRKLARHEVSGQRRNKFRPEGTMEINLIWRSLFRFRRPFRTGFLLPRYQTLRVWLISGCAFGTSRRAIIFIGFQMQSKVCQPSQESIVQPKSRYKSKAISPLSFQQ
jgi:hypothetical protein